MCMKKLSAIIITLTIALYLPVQTQAWGMTGHRITGQIADSYLSGKARKAIKAILGDESIAMASNWADFVKSDSTYNYLYSWHYVNFDDNYNLPEMREHLKKDSTVNAYTKLEFLITQLKEKDLPQEKKIMYLRLLIHIVGDIHQPFHTGHAYDKGGNDVKVLWFNQPTNIHSVWDSQLIDFQQLSYTEYATAINHTTKAQRAQWQSGGLAGWLHESQQLAQQLYAGVRPDEKLSYRYNYKYIDTLNGQLLKGGVRLAGLLNEIFG